MAHCGNIALGDHFINIGPPQFTQSWTDMVAPAKSGHDADTEVDGLLDTLLLCCGTVSPHRYTITYVGEDECLYQQLSDAFWELMSDSRQTHQYTIASLHNRRDVTIPCQM